MANAAGFIQESIWRDEHFRQLSRTAQAMYMQLLSQKELDCAGVLPLHPTKWVKGCDELTITAVMHDLDELQEHRFVFYDEDTDEAFIRSYIRNSNVLKIPNMRKSALRAAALVASKRIRAALAEELRSTGIAEFLEVAEKVNPSGTVTEPTGVGVGKGVTLTLVSNHFGEEPSQFCSQHPDGTDIPCRPCAQARESFPQRIAQWKSVQASQRQHAIDTCLLCDDHGVVAVGDDAIRKCDHQVAANG